MKVHNCPKCGGTLIEIGQNKVKCRCCDTVYQDNEAQTCSTQGKDKETYELLYKLKRATDSYNNIYLKKKKTIDSLISQINSRIEADKGIDAVDKLDYEKFLEKYRQEKVNYRKKIKARNILIAVFSFLFVIAVSVVVVFQIIHFHKYGETEYEWAQDYSTCTIKQVCVGDSSHVITQTLQSQKKVTKEAACTSAGLIKYEVIYEGNLIEKQVEIPAFGHREIKDFAVDPTCVGVGKTEGSHCSVCNEVMKQQQIVPALGHREVIDAEVKATCEGTGLTQGSHCSVCYAVVKKQQVVPALGHKEIIDTGIAPTCTTNGLTDGSHCSVCGVVLKEQKALQATGHTKSDWIVGQAATCTIAGYSYKECTVCHTQLESYTIPAKHNFSSDGICTVCGGVDISKNVAKSLAEKELLSETETIEELKKKGYSDAKAREIVNNSGVAWNTIAKLKADALGKSAAVNPKLVREELKNHKFTDAQIEYAIQYANIAWLNNAKVHAEQYINDFTGTILPKDIMEYLQNVLGYTTEQSEYVVKNCGIDWQKQALLILEDYDEKSTIPPTPEECQTMLQGCGFAETDIQYAMNHYTPKIPTYIKNGIGITIISKKGWLPGTGAWVLRLTNYTNSDCKFYYNSQMCNNNDAKNWTGLSHVAQTEVMKAGQHCQLEINENGTAGSIALSYISNNNRLIFSANGLSSKGTLSPEACTVSFNRYSTQSGITVGLIGKNGKIWLVELTNHTNTDQTFEYNTMMCSENNARNWQNLNHLATVTLGKGECTSTPLEIMEDGSKNNCIAISYLCSDGYRKVFYAKDLNTSGIMSAYHNEILVSIIFSLETPQNSKRVKMKYKFAI